MVGALNYAHYNRAVLDQAWLPHFLPTPIHLMEHIGTTCGGVGGGVLSFKIVNAEAVSQTT